MNPENIFINIETDSFFKGQSVKNNTFTRLCKMIKDSIEENRPVFLKNILPGLTGNSIFVALNFNEIKDDCSKMPHGFTVELFDMSDNQTTIFTIMRWAEKKGLAKTG